MSVVGGESLACAIDSPWVSVIRKVDRAPAGIRIHDRLKLKKQIMRHEEYTTAEFAELQKKLVSCFRFASLIYQKGKTPPKTPLN
jgi:hypothetical protein